MPEIMKRKTRLKAMLKDIKVAEFAQMAEVSLGTAWRYLNGEAAMPRNKAMAVASCSGMDAELLLQANRMDHYDVTGREDEAAPSILPPIPGHDERRIPLSEWLQDLATELKAIGM